MSIIWQGAPIIDYKNIKLLRRYISKMAKYYHLELHLSVKKNRGIYQFQLKEQKT